MHVLLTTALMRSGVITHVIDLANGLIKQDIKVTIALRYRIDHANDKDKLILRSFDEKSIPYFFYRNYEELVIFSSKNNINLIHAHSRLAYPTSYFASRKLRIPLFITLHGVFQWLKYYPSTFARANKIIAIGPVQAKSAGSKYSYKTVIIDNGIDVDRYIPIDTQTALLNENDNSLPLKIIQFGRYDKETSKGISALNEAVKLLRDHGKNIELKMIGSNHCDEIDQFNIIGWVEDPVEYLQWGNIAFGHGRALREAMAAGNVGYLLGSGYGGHVGLDWFSEENYRPISALSEYNLPNPDQFTIYEELNKLYNDRILLETLRKEARTIAENYFDINEMVRKTINVYSYKMKR